MIRPLRFFRICDKINSPTAFIKFYFTFFFRAVLEERPVFIPTLFHFSKTILFLQIDVSISLKKEKKKLAPIAKVVLLPDAASKLHNGSLPHCECEVWSMLFACHPWTKHPGDAVATITERLHTDLAWRAPTFKRSCGCFVSCTHRPAASEAVMVAAKKRSSVAAQFQVGFNVGWDAEIVLDFVRILILKCVRRSWPTVAFS